jgi:hypothetical protein
VISPQNFSTSLKDSIKETLKKVKKKNKFQKVAQNRFLDGILAKNPGTISPVL